ncbi:HEPN domain-containing protein [Vreelandella neptunia]|uniref:HEPN domain-containing protein n=1 Tax=Vreelandella neptunia TaxID=115551 RepID=A0ABZ0YIQ6_9GAMM|nr:HEPN domain-containing protein [Halomonas neptunia]MDN3562080.1 HEPN domain-containing protein [Halomonas neptunia]WQH11783.1 HEPN domain-containing protein [Halomonas neptunia]
MHIGKFRHQINVSNEFSQLSRDDEEAACMLAEKGHFRQACYCIVQAMEKLIRAKIFSLVNANIEYFRIRNQTHSIDSAVDFLIEIISNDQTIREQVSSQLKYHVLGDTKYSYLHNNLRYPSYFNKYNSYSILEVDFRDFELLMNRFKLLKKFLHDLHKFS